MTVWYYLAIGLYTEYGNRFTHEYLERRPEHWSEYEYKFKNETKQKMKLQTKFRTRESISVSGNKILLEFQTQLHINK